VLVVDDNQDLASVMAEFLRASGYEVRVAHDAEAAMKMARSRRYEAVLLDIGLPGMNGYQLAERLRLDGSVRDALLIAISGYGREEDLLRAAEAGFDHHLVKPLDIERLRNLLATSA